MSLQNSFSALSRGFAPERVKRPDNITLCRGQHDPREPVCSKLSKIPLICHTNPCAFKLLSVDL
jgi:hypothetical protein